jgi:hypothetical protein
VGCFCTQGVAFEKVPSRTYYPAVSCYGGGRVRANFGPTWLKPPPGAAPHSPAATGAAAAGAAVGAQGPAAAAAAAAAAGGNSGYSGGGGGPLLLPPPPPPPQASSFHVGPLRAVAELKPMPKPEAAEHARAVRRGWGRWMDEENASE